MTLLFCPRTLQESRQVVDDREHRLACGLRRERIKVICVLGTPLMSHERLKCNLFEALLAFKNTCKQTLPARSPGWVD